MRSVATIRHCAAESLLHFQMLGDADVERSWLEGKHRLERKHTGLEARVSVDRED